MYPLSWLSLDSCMAPWDMVSHTASLFSRMCLLGLVAREPRGKLQRSEEQSLLGSWSCSFPACNPPRQVIPPVVSQSNGPMNPISRRCFEELSEITVKKKWTQSKGSSTVNKTNGLAQPRVVGPPLRLNHVQCQLCHCRQDTPSHSTRPTVPVLQSFSPPEPV